MALNALTQKLTQSIDHESNKPLYLQLGDKFKELISKTELMPGELLPSSRELAEALGLSRKTVSRCYEDLLSIGYVKVEKGIGTFVSSENRARTTSSEVIEEVLSSNKPHSRYAKALMKYSLEPTNQGDLPELHFGAPPASQLPVKAWRKIMLEQIRNSEQNEFYYDTEAFGYLPLRQAIASYLTRSRALNCDADQVIVFSHALSPLRLFAQIAVDSDDIVAMEEPGFPFARKVFESLGAKIIPIPLDEQGLSIHHLERLTSKTIRVIYVTPSHQDPSGVVMSLERRKQLLAFAKKHQCLIVEDDYDCEFRYTGSNLPSLMALDDGNSVVYMGDMWKTLFPLINIGYMVLPKALVEVFKKAQSLAWTKASTSLPYFDQLAVTAFMNEGYFERHLRKTKAIYASRYRNLILGITRFFGQQVDYAKDSGSMELMIQFKLPFSEAEILNTARESGLSLISTQPYYINKTVKSEFLLAFVMLEESEMLNRLEIWAQRLGCCQ